MKKVRFSKKSVRSIRRTVRFEKQKMKKLQHVCKNFCTR